MTLLWFHLMPYTELPDGRGQLDEMSINFTPVFQTERNHAYHTWYC